jgi:hypothetical protein
VRQRGSWLRRAVSRSKIKLEICMHAHPEHPEEVRALKATSRQRADAGLLPAVIPNERGRVPARTDASATGGASIPCRCARFDSIQRFTSNPNSRFTLVL